MPVPIAKETSYFECVETHFDRLIHYSLDRYGSTRSGLWMASLDIGTNEMLQLPSEQAVNDIRYVPGAYWYADQPMLVAAHAVAARSACKCYSDSANEYLRTWGHLIGQNSHLDDLQSFYWHASGDQFRSVPLDKRIDFSHTPAWETMWSVDAKNTERLIRGEVARVQTEKQLTPREVLHATVSLAWLATKTDGSHPADRRQIERLLKDGLSSTNLRRRVMSRDVSPLPFRFAVCCLDNAGRLESEDLNSMGTGHADALAEQIVSQFSEKSTAPFVVSRSTLAIGESLLSFFGQLGSEASQHAAIQIGEAVAQTTRRPDEEYSDAEIYGRAIHFLVRASKLLANADLMDRAQSLADHAIDRLFVEDCGMFRSRVGVDRCDAADGIGYLMLALLSLDREDPTEHSCFSF
ncbi:hypothetical protein [Planctomycetes bacterium K23_9]|uniref:hypothetical protein n=1 Tax=Stieleria marina TaxID=1930275 RepID=UPI0011A8048A